MDYRYFKAFILTAKLLSFSEAARIAFEILNNYPAAVLFIKRGASVLRGNREEISKLAAVAENILGDTVLAEQLMNR